MLDSKTDIGAFQTDARKNVTIENVTIKNKTYDGTTPASIDLTSTTQTGIESNDKVILDLSAITANFADANAGNDKTVTISGTFGLSGEYAHNYILTQQPNVSNITANITKAKLKVTARSLNMDYGTKPSDLNLSAAYDIADLVNGESEAVLHDKPKVAIDPSITSTSKVGNYPGVIIASGVTATNYDSNYKAGDLTIKQNTTGSHLSFHAISNDKIYGGADFNLTSTHSLGKTVRYESLA